MRRSFQTGETYLVYASDDEESTNSYNTSSCTRTRRISDAGEDLAYLYFYKEHPAPPPAWKLSPPPIDATGWGSIPSIPKR